jgi:hypothetical protein
MPYDFRGANIGGNFGQIIGLAAMLRQQRLEEAQMGRDAALRQQLVEAMSGFDPAAPETTLAKLYPVAPEYAASLQKTLLEGRKAQVDYDRAKVDLSNAELTGKKTGQELQKGVNELKLEHAKILASQAWALPPQERTQERLQTILRGNINMISGVHPALAQEYEQKQDAPELWPNVFGIARTHGLSDPYEQMDIKAEEYRRNRQTDTDLPMTRYQQAQIDAGAKRIDAEEKARSRHYDEGNRQKIVTLHKEFLDDKVIKDYRSRLPEVAALEALIPQEGERITPQQGFEFAKQAIKAKDPESTISKPEVDSWFASRPLPSRVAGAGRSAVGDSPLSREDMLASLSAAKDGLTGFGKSYEEAIKHYEDYAKQIGLEGEVDFRSLGQAGAIDPRAERLKAEIAAHPAKADAIRAYAKQHGVILP